MTEPDVYGRLRKAIDGMPIGIQITESGIEIELLKEIFTTEETELACNLSMFKKSAKNIANSKVEYVENSLRELLEYIIEAKKNIP